LLHISEISWERIQSVEDVLKVGQEIEVKLLDIDRDNKMKLSRRVLLPKPEGFVERPPRSNNRDSRPRHDGDRDHRERRDDRNSSPRK